VLKIELTYSGQTVPVEIPDNVRIEIVKAGEQPLRDQAALFAQALAHPINSVSLEDYMNSDQEFFFIVNDATRPTPTATVLEAIYPFIKGRNVKFMVATGTHRRPTSEELQNIMGRFYREFNENICIHDARNDMELEKAGCSKNGHEIWINRHIYQSQKLVVINSVEPHYFAGYTGGRKSIVPGVAGYQTIEQNHKLAMSRDSASLKLDDNPVHEDMIDSLRCLDDKEIFSVQTVLDINNNLVAVTTGHIQDSFLAAVRVAESVFSVKVRKPVDIVIAVVGPPKDINLYQAQNSLENAKIILKDGGILILVSPCREGIGPSTFYDLMSEFSTPQEILDRVESGYQLGYHKAVKLAQILKRAEIWGVTDLPGAQLEAIFIKSFNSIQDAVNQAIRGLEKEPTMTVLMDSDRIVPVMT